MNIDKFQTFILDDYEFINFILLEPSISEEIRLWRNHPKIRNVMYSKDEISEEQHNNFINSLRISNSNFYWLVRKKDTPIGVVSLVDFNPKECEGHSGFYLLPDYHDKGIGLEFIGNITNFLFNEIGCRKLFGHIMIENRNSLIINYILGFDIKPDTVMINGERFIEVEGNAESFSHHYTSILDNKILLKKIREFNKLYNQIKKNGN